MPFMHYYKVIQQKNKFLLDIDVTKTSYVNMILSVNIIRVQPDILEQCPLTHIKVSVI